MGKILSVILITLQQASSLEYTFYWTKGEQDHGQDDTRHATENALRLQGEWKLEKPNGAHELTQEEVLYLIDPTPERAKRSELDLHNMWRKLRALPYLKAADLKAPAKAMAGNSVDGYYTLWEKERSGGWGATKPMPAGTDHVEKFTKSKNFVEGENSPEK